jgi:tetratricopeptide (TPR) repeat protein
MPIPALFAVCSLLLPLLAQEEPLAKARASLNAAEQQHGPDSVAAAQARLQVGSQLLRAGQLQPARDELLRAIAAAERAGEPRLAATGRCTLAAVWLDLNDPAAARDAAATALDWRRVHLPAGHVAIAEACNALAAAHAALGELAAARPLFAEARAGFEVAPGQGMRAAMVSGNLAALAARDLDYLGAVDHARAAVEAASKARGAEDRTTLQLRANLGRALLSVGRLDAAMHELEPVLAAQQHQLGARHLRTFETEHTLLGLQMTTMPEVPALATASRLAELAAELFGERHATTMSVRRLCIEAQLRAGEYAAALTSVERLLAAPELDAAMTRSLQLVRSRLLAELDRHDDTVAACDEIERAARQRTEPAVRIYELIQLAFVHARGGRRPRAIALVQEVLADPRLELAWTVPLLRVRSQLAGWLAEAGDFAGAARLDIDTLLASGQALDATLPSLLESERRRQKAELQSCLDRLLAAEEGVDARAVFAAVLAWKGCVGRELEADLAALRQRARGPQQALRDRLQQVQRSLGELLERGAEGTAEWRELQREHAAIGNRLSAHAAGRAERLDAAAVQRALPEGSALVEFVRWQRGGEPWLTAFVMPAAGEPQRIELGALAPIAQAVSAHVQIVGRRLQALGAAGAALATAAANRVQALCWQPLQNVLLACERVYLAGDDCLLLLPFDSLPAADGKLLLEAFDLRQLRSGLDLLAPAPPAGGGMLLVDGAGADLPGAHAEVAAIAKLWQEQHGSKAVVLDGADAGALATAMAGAEFVHFAAHGNLRRGAAEHGASLELAGQRLSAAELAFLDLGRARLVVLSACDTARGDVVAGEHLLGLRRALRLAGAAASVTALWRIDDAATVAFMVPFWSELARGTDPATALRRCKLQALAAARQQHGDPLPGRWAAFVLEGR